MRTRLARIQRVAWVGARGPVSSPSPAAARGLFIARKGAFFTMSTPFTPQKQLAFGSIVGGLLKQAQAEHELTDQDLVALLLALAAGQAGVARWSMQMFINQAAKCFEEGPGRVRPTAPMPGEVQCTCAAFPGLCPRHPFSSPIKT